MALGNRRRAHPQRNDLVGPRVAERSKLTRREPYAYDRAVPELPRGTVTFAFTDVEDSTEVLKRLGDGYADVLTAHGKIIRETFSAHASATWPHEVAVRVRMGLHAGEPAVHEDGYVGLDVVRAARI
jgi:class 3 adenylate cyclase